MFKSSLHQMIESVIAPMCTCGRVLELGPGEVWPGLHLLQKQKALEVIGMGYQFEERQKALAKAKVMGLSPYVRYESGALDKLTLPDKSVDTVLSFGGLSSWEQPTKMLNEVFRVLKTGGLFYIGDVRRDASWLVQFLSGQRRKGLKSVYQTRKNSKTASELRELLMISKLENAQVEIKGPDVWILKKAD